MTVDVHRAREDRRQPAHDPLRLALGCDLLTEHDEFIAAEAGQRVGRTEHALHPLRRLGEHLVAGGVTQAVVHELEVVEVHEDDRHATRAPCQACQRLLEAVHEQLAVRELGQRIVQRLVLEQLLRRPVRTHIARDPDDAVDVVTLGAVGRDLDGPCPAAGRVAVLERAQCPGERFAGEPVDLVHAIARDELGQRAADEQSWGEVVDAATVGQHQSQVVVEDGRDHVGDASEQGPVARFTRGSSHYQRYRSSVGRH